MAVQSPLYVLTGPTAVGKTELALRWAETHGAEIISCDSLLFYRGMDIGTAKPTPAERARVPHHLIDICAPDEPMNVARYVELARAAVAEIRRRGRRVLVTGGSGFYLKAFFGPVSDNVAVPATLRKDIEQRLADEGLPALVAELRALNPAGLDSLDTANPRRVVRALERCRASGRTLAELRTEFAAQPGPFSDQAVQGVLLTRESADLQNRIAQRVKAMLAAGLVAEVERLRTAGFERNPSAAGAIGYRETRAMLDGALTSEQLADEITRNTWSLVRKQRTWFRHQLAELRPFAAAEATAEGLFATA